MVSGQATVTSPTSSTRPAASANIPPGSRLPRLVQTMLWMRNPSASIRASERRYGNVFRVGMPGVPGFVYVSDPALARQVFTTDRDIGRAGAARRDFLEPLVGESSLLCLDGEEWMRQRKLLGSAFHGKRIERYRDEIAAVATEHVRRWPAGEPFGIRPRMQAVTLDVIIRVVFGVRDTDRMDRLRGLLPRLMAAAETVDAAIMVLPAPVWSRVEPLLGRVPRSPVARFAGLRAAADELIYDEIARRRVADDVADRTDILSVLLRGRDEDGRGLTDAELRDALMTLLVAGHETTATALSWAFERLVRNPAVMDRLGDAITAGDERYLDAVLKETLRTRPVVPDMPRILTEPMELGGYHVPAGWWVSPAVPPLHETAEHFPEPEEFRPERFLAEDAPLHAWLPFGGGRRQCLGSHFAMLEMAAIIPEVLGRFRVGLAGDPEPERPKLRHVTLAPAKDGRVVAESR